MGRDRPGIVASVTAPLAGLGCNLEDVATTILGGYFSMMLICSGQVTGEQLREQLQHLERSGLTLAVWEIEPVGGASRATHVLTVYGPDQIGIVSRVAAVLADHSVNISDMSCRLHEETSPIYVVTMEIELPDGLETRVREALARALQPMGLSSNLSRIEPDAL